MEFFSFNFNSVDEMNSESPYSLLLRGACLIPFSHYLLAILLIYLVFVYNFLEFHFFQDFVSGFRGQSVILTFDSCSDVYEEVVSKCRILTGRYLSTPWLCSPHLQTVFLRFFGRPPVFSYRRQLFQTGDGGTVALDWLTSADVAETDFQAVDGAHKDDKAPIVIVVPGLTSDSASVYIKHLAFHLAKRGWNVVVSNHRGLGGISLTSDFFYNGGWTKDMRKVVEHLHGQFPEAPLFAVGTSLGANMMVKYIGEDGADILIAGAAVVCCPWDLLLCDRFIGRKAVQRFYDKALASGLKRYAQLHKQFFSRIANWEGIEKSRRVREFDTNGTCLAGGFETADMYYRKSSCASYVGSVEVPLLCIGALDDPVCTSEAIIWDECRKNKNVVLATTQHGSHLGYFEGITAKSMWWVRAVDEFLTVLHSSPKFQKKKEMEISSLTSPLKSSMDQGSYVYISGDGVVIESNNGPKASVEVLPNKPTTRLNKDKDAVLDAQIVGGELSIREINIGIILIPLRKCMDQLSRYSRKSSWLVFCIAMITTWPLAGSVLRLFFQKKFRTISRITQRRWK